MDPNQVPMSGANRKSRSISICTYHAEQLIKRNPKLLKNKIFNGNFRQVFFTYEFFYWQILLFWIIFRPELVCFSCWTGKDGCQDRNVSHRLPRRRRRSPEPASCPDSAAGARPSVHSDELSYVHYEDQAWREGRISGPRTGRTGPWRVPAFPEECRRGAVSAAVRWNSYQRRPGRSSGFSLWQRGLSFSAYSSGKFVYQTKRKQSITQSVNQSINQITVL